MASDVRTLLGYASVIAVAKDDGRKYRLGAVGLRGDGVIVYSANGNPKEPEPKHHAEYRLSRKLTKDSVVLVARVLANGDWAMARPCRRCLCRLKNIKVLEVYYTISAGEYGCLYLG